MTTDDRIKAQSILKNTTTVQKMALFYELCCFIVEAYGEDGEDEDLNNLVDDIANVKNDIENL